jgi:hypothetical protein
MGARPSGPGPAELERALAGLGRSLDYPTQADLSLAVARRIEVARAARPGLVAFRRGLRSLRPVIRPAWGGASLGRRVAVAFLALAVFLAGLLTFSPGAREAVADFLGIGGVHIKQTQSPIPTSLPTGLGSDLFLGHQVPIDQVGAEVAFHVLVPSAPSLGSPDEVWLSRNVFPDGQVSLVYRARPGLPSAGPTGAGLLLTEFRASVNAGFLQKVVGEGTTLSAVRVKDRYPGFWIEGRPHEVMVVGPDGQPVPDTVRLAGNVLIWEQGGVTLRIESTLGLAQVLRLAASVR